MRDFDKEFENTRKQIMRTALITFIIHFILSLGALASLCWMVYVILKHFGIVG